MLKRAKKSKKGAASFYIVAFSTLLLMVVATSFAMVTISEMSRTMNDDLAQSAYDSALAGIEDAKVAFANYQRCLEAGEPASTLGASEPVGSDSSCKKIMWHMANPSCNMVAEMLYDIDGEVTVGGVEVGGSGGDGTTTNQAYTCVKILTELTDYRSSLGNKTGKYVQTIRAGVADGGSNNVDKIRFSWQLKKEKDSVNTGTLNSTWNSINSDGVGIFKNVNSLSIPPVIEMQIVQTAENFNLAQFDSTVTGQTNRATLYLLPSNKQKNDSGEVVAINEISADQVVATNNHSPTKTPFVIYCNNTTEFWCSVDINLPKALGGTDAAKRANETFLISVSLPYKEPDTDFSLELICNDAAGGGCGGKTAQVINGGSSSVVAIKNTQVAIESTGRANDVYRRVETRFETSDTSFGMGKEAPYYALMILGNETVRKNMTATYEGYFDF